MPVRTRLAFRFYQTLWAAVDWLYPPVCGGCQKPAERWCSACCQSTSLILPPVCPVCGLPQPAERICRRCASTPPAYNAVRSWAVFEGPLRNAIHQLKYKRNLGLGERLAQDLAKSLQPLGWPVDLVVPVPLSIARFAERGYNQATLLARPLALGMDLPFRPQALTKVRETRSQVDLTGRERKQNVSGAFRASPALVRGRSVLVIDDVMTSGATLESCASALKDAGAGRVYCLTLARAVQK